MDAAQLARWTRFAAKGGIGRGTAIRDCVAERDEDLMFMRGDEIVVLMSLKDGDRSEGSSSSGSSGGGGRFLGYCEGVVGQFLLSDIQLRGKLKRAVFTRRSSSQPPRAGTSASAGGQGGGSGTTPSPGVGARRLSPSPGREPLPSLASGSLPGFGSSSGLGSVQSPVSLSISPSASASGTSALLPQRTTPESRRSLPAPTPSSRRGASRSPSPAPGSAAGSHRSLQPAGRSPRPSPSPVRSVSQGHGRPSPSQQTPSPGPGGLVHPTPALATGGRRLSQFLSQHLQHTPSPVQSGTAGRPSPSSSHSRPGSSSHPTPPSVPPTGAGPSHSRRSSLSHSQGQGQEHPTTRKRGSPSPSRPSSGAQQGTPTGIFGIRTSPSPSRAVSHSRAPSGSRTSPSPSRPTSQSLAHLQHAPIRPPPTPSSASVSGSVSGNVSAAPSSSSWRSISARTVSSSSPSTATTAWTTVSTPWTTASELSTAERSERSERERAGKAGWNWVSLPSIARGGQASAPAGPAAGAESEEKGKQKEDRRGILGLGLGLGLPTPQSSLSGPSSSTSASVGAAASSAINSLPQPPEAHNWPADLGSMEDTAGKKRSRRTGIWGSPSLGGGSGSSGTGAAAPASREGGSSSSSPGMWSPTVLSPTVLSPTAMSPLTSPLSATFPHHPMGNVQQALSLARPGAEEGEEERTPLAQTGFRPRSMDAGEFTPRGAGVARAGSINRPVGGRPMPGRRMTGGGEMEGVYSPEVEGAAELKEELEEREVDKMVRESRVGQGAGVGVVDDRSEESSLASRSSMPNLAGHGGVLPKEEDNQAGEEHASDGEFGIGLTLLQTGDLSEDESEIASVASVRDLALHSRQKSQSQTQSLTYSRLGKGKPQAEEEPEESGFEGTDGEGEEGDVSADPDASAEGEGDLDVYGGAARLRSRGSSARGSLSRLSGLVSGAAGGSMPVSPPRSRSSSVRSGSRRSGERTEWADGSKSGNLQPRRNMGSRSSIHSAHSVRSTHSGPSAQSARSSRSGSLSHPAGVTSDHTAEAHLPSYPSVTMGGTVFPVRPPLVTRASTSTQASFSPADLYEAYELGMNSPAVSLRSQRSPGLPREVEKDRDGQAKGRGYFDFQLPEDPVEKPEEKEEGDETLLPSSSQGQAEPVTPQEAHPVARDQRPVPTLASPPTASLAQRRRGLTNLLPPVEIELTHAHPLPVRTSASRSSSARGSPASGAATPETEQAKTDKGSSSEGVPLSARSMGSFSSNAPSTATVTQVDGPTPRPALVRRSVTLSALPSPASLSPAVASRSSIVQPQFTPLMHSPLSPTFSTHPSVPPQQGRSFTLPIASSSSQNLTPSPLSPLSPTGSTSSRLSPANMASAIRARMEAQRAATPSTPITVEEPKDEFAELGERQAKPRLVVVNLTPDQSEEESIVKDEDEDEVVVFSPHAPLARPTHISAPVPAPSMDAPQGLLQEPGSLLSAPRPATSMPNTPLSAVSLESISPLQPPVLVASQPSPSSAPTTPSGPLYPPQMRQSTLPGSPLHSLNSTLNLASKAHQDSPGTPTFRGHMSRDLLSAQGPVPIAFQLSASGAMVPVQQPQPVPMGVVPPPTLFRTPQLRSATQPGEHISDMPFYPKPRPRSQSFSNFTTPLAEALLDHTDVSSEERTPDLYRTEDEKEKRFSPQPARSISGPLTIRPPGTGPVPGSMRSPLPTSPLAHSATSREDDDDQELQRPSPFSRREANSAPVTPMREDHDELGQFRSTLAVVSDSHPSSSVPTPSPPTMHVRSQSLRSKISMNALRAKKDIRSASPALSGSGSLAQMPLDEQNHLVLQVEDAEFEMVKPSLGVKSDEGSVEGTYESPTSTNSHAASLPAPISIPVPSVWQQKQPETPAQTPAQMEAYRNLEYRWIMMMQTTKPAGARKQKKVKKLVWDGVPSSVRGKVWAYLTDANSRMLPGLFEKLASRGNDRTTMMIKDIERLFPDQPHLRDPNGSLVKLLQAYLSMVPDVQYDRELAMVAGNILSLSPEEDAFWTFVAVMDNQIRLYYALNPIQLDVDGQLFAKAVEWMDASLAKMLFEQCGVSPNLLCKAWFASVFCSVLPIAHLERVWDIYLLEGASFLFRTGLVILQSAKRHLASSPSFSTSALSFLTRPPANIFDADPETFISRVASIRMREDDLRRLRPKIEAQLKLTNTPHRPQIVNRDIIKPPTILTAHV